MSNRYSTIYSLSALACLSVAACAAPVETSSASAERLVTASPSGTLHFTADAWKPTLEGSLRAGAVLGIDFDAARLPQCRQLNRNTAWSIEMHYRFDDGPIATITVGDPGNFLAKRSLDVPETAGSVTLWFENTARSNGGRDIVCQAWDSDYGRNYTFPTR